MPRSFQTRYGKVRIYPLKIPESSLQQIKNNGYFQREAGAIFGNCLVNRLKEEFPREDLRIVHFDPGAITDSAGQAVYSILYRNRIKRVPLLSIPYGEEQLVLITQENHPENDGIAIRESANPVLGPKIIEEVKNLNKESPLKFKVWTYLGHDN